MKNFCLILSLFITQLTFSQIITKTKNGKVEGIQKEDISIFKGIPFAEPPIGELRWRAPKPLKNWNGIKECVDFSASPMQAEPKPFFCWSEEFIAPPKPLSEDCLYLNIWTKNLKSSKPKPVFVWIYGGGFGSGSAACAIYDGEEYAKRDVVFVSLNYRVGVFGFMAHPELSKEQNGSSGNYGLLDQIEALKWIQNNIKAFGGDPKNVTVAGQSAGSMSVNALIASPLAKGLFQKAIPQSGAILGGRFITPLSEAENGGMKVQQKMKVNSIAELRNISAELLQKDGQVTRFSPNVDGYVLPTNLEKYFQEGKQNQVSVLQGWVTGDAALAVQNPQKAEVFKKQMETKYGDKSEEFFSAFPSENTEESTKSQTKIGLMQFPILGNHQLAKYNSKPTFTYEIDYVPTDKPDFQNYGAFHTSEVPFALHTLHLWNRPWQKRDLDQQELVSNCWLNFIKTGIPAPNWRPYTPENQSIMLLNTDLKQIENKYYKEIQVLEKLGL